MAHPVEGIRCSLTALGCAGTVVGSGCSRLRPGSPLLSLRLPSPEVVVESLAAWRKSVHQPHRVANLFVVTFVNREGDTPVPPHWYAARECYPASGLQPAAKVRLEPPNPESRAEEVIVEDAEPYLENPPLTPPVPPSTLPLRPNAPPVVLGSSLPRAVLPNPHSSRDIGAACLSCVADEAAVGRELKRMSYRLRFGPQGWESMARAADQSFLKSRWSHASETRCACSVCFFVLSRLCNLRTVAVDLQYVE